MEEERHTEEIKDEQTWLMIIDGENDSERHLFYSLTHDRYHVQFVPELQNKYVICSYDGLLVLRDKSTDDCSILNMLTMEILQLPPLNIPPDDITDCVISSPKMDASCRLILYDGRLHKFRSCQLGDSEFIERDLTYIDAINQLINFKGKFYVLTHSNWNLIAFDFADPDLRHHEQVVMGDSILGSSFIGYEEDVCLVESGEDLLLVFMGGYDYEISVVKIFKADFGIGQWVIPETLGDRAIFLGHQNTLSSLATAAKVKGNAAYWVKAPSSLFPLDKHLYMYDIEDRSISMSLLLPIVGTYSSLHWVSFRMTCNEQKDMNSLFESFPIETSFHLKKKGKATIESTILQIEQRKPQKRVKKESLWADLQKDLLLEIFPHLFAGDSVAFRSVCRSWYSISPPSTRTSQQLLRPLKSSDCTSPFLMCPGNKACHPIHGELYSMELFPDIVMEGYKVRAARDGWLLMDYFSMRLVFYNPFTEAEIILPECDALFYYSLYFSAPPTSADCLVVVAARRFNDTCAICFKKSEDEGWTCREINESESFVFSNCNAVAYQGLYYFLGHGAKLLIFNPEKDELRVIEAPKFISELKGLQYMLESDGKLIAVFVSADGSSVYTCEWNFCTSKWEILGSLGNVMLFVSHPLSICKRATVSGTGNKIYFPRVVGDGQILFYSLATRMYHTFEMGSSYSNFFASKYYTEYNGWFMP